MPIFTHLTAETLDTVDLDPGLEDRDESSALPSSQRPLVVLVVDDDPQILTAAAKGLRAAGHDVLTAEEGRGALEAIEERLPDVVVLDAMLPGVQGFDVCRKVKSAPGYGHIRVLMMSGLFGGWRLAEDAKSTYQADDFLEKPFTPSQLLERVQCVADKPAAGTAATPKLNDEARDHYQRGVRAYRGEDYSQALTALRQAEAAAPHAAQVHLLVGHVFVRTGKSFEAIYHYERAITLEPGLFSAAKNLAVLYQSKGFINKAQEMWERALYLAPTDELRFSIRHRLKRSN